MSATKEEMLKMLNDLEREAVSEWGAPYNGQEITKAIYALIESAPSYKDEDVKRLVDTGHALMIEVDDAEFWLRHTEAAGNFKQALRPFITLHSGDSGELKGKGEKE
jgi:hypothetical protein